MSVSLRRVEANEKRAFWDLLTNDLIEDAAQSDHEQGFGPLGSPNFDRNWLIVERSETMLHRFVAP